MSRLPRSSSLSSENPPAQKRSQTKQRQAQKSSSNAPSTKKKALPSPFSTGGGGSLFEKNVGACYLSWMLLNVAPRGFEDVEITEVKFQRRYIDQLPMDDVIVSVGVSHAPRGIARLSLQLKHDVEWGSGEKNETFHAVLRACWDTFKSSDFAPGFDAYGIVVGRDKSDYPAYREVIGYAGSCADGADFLRVIDSVTSAKHRSFVALIRGKLNAFLKEDGYEEEVNDEELWHFCQGLRLLQFDLLEEGARDYQHCLAQIKMYFGLNKTNRAREIWNELLRFTGDALPRAGSFRRDDLKLRLSRFHSLSHQDDLPSSASRNPVSTEPSDSVPDSASLSAGTEALDASALDVSLLGAKTGEFLQSLPAVSNDSSQVTRRIEEARLETKLDAARDLLRGGEAIAARKILAEVRAWDEFPLSSRLQFRLAANLGSCAYLLGDEPLAIAEFRAAYRQEKTNPKALVIGAQAELLDDQPDVALPLCEAALSREPRFADAALQYIRALYACGKKEELAAWLEQEEWVQDDPSCARALADIDALEGNTEAAIARLNALHKRHPQDQEIVSHLASLILTSAYTAWKNEPHLAWSLPPALRQNLQRAANLLKPGTKDQFPAGNPQQRVPDLSNRAVALMLLEREDEALQSLEEALRFSPESPILWLNLGWLRNKRNEKELAIAALEKALAGLGEENQENANSRWEAIRGLAYAYYALSQWPKLRDLLTPVLGWDGKSFAPQGPESWSPDLLNTLSLWLMATHYLSREASDPSLRDSFEAEKKAAAAWLEKTLPEDPQALGARADLAWVEGRFLDATRLLRKAVEHAQGAHRQRFTLGLAETLFQRRRYAAAVPFYEEVVQEGAVNIYLAHYAVALLRSKQGTAEAVRLTQVVRDAYPRVKDRRGEAFALFTEIEASTAEYVGDWETAIRLRRELCETNPERADYRIALALIEYQSGSASSARATLNAVAAPDPALNPQLLMELARARATLRIPGALELAYGVWRISTSDPELQSRYISLFQYLNGEENALLRPLHVSSDCAVTLRVQAEAWTRVIVGKDSQPQTLLPNEIASSHPQARLLSGKRVGDEVTLNNSPWGTVTATITEIRHKFVYAYQECINRFGRGELQHHSFMVGKIDDPDEWLKKQAELMRGQRESWIFISDFYRRQSLPLSAIGVLRNRNVLQLWSEISGVGGRFYCMNDGLDRVLQDRIDLHAATTLVLDPTALACIALLNVGDYVGKRFPHLLVPHAVWQEIYGFWQQETLSPPVEGYLWHNGVQLCFSKINEADVQRRQTFLKDILDFIQEKCEVVPVASLVEETQWVKALGKGSVAAMLLAKERDIPLWSDDARLRLWAGQTFSAKTTYFWPVLLNLYSKGFTGDEMKEAVCQLVLQGYSYIALPAEILVEGLKRNEFELTGETRTLLFRTFNGHDTNVKWGAHEVARFLHELWNEHPLEFKLRKILYQTLDSYMYERSTVTALNELQKVLAEYFQHEEFSLRLLLSDIKRWEISSLRVINRGSLLEEGKIQVAPLDISLRFAHPEFRRMG